MGTFVGKDVIVTGGMSGLGGSRCPEIYPWRGRFCERCCTGRRWCYHV